MTKDKLCSLIETKEHYISPQSVSLYSIDSPWPDNMSPKGKRTVYKEIVKLCNNLLTLTSKGLRKQDQGTVISIKIFLRAKG